MKNQPHKMEIPTDLLNPREILLFPFEMDYDLGTVIEKADRNGEPTEYQITRKDEKGTWGIDLTRKRADND